MLLKRFEYGIIAQWLRLPGRFSRAFLLGGFDFDWRTWRAELRDVTIHGLEPPGAAPLFHARRVEAGLKVVSLWRRKLDLQSLEADEPQVNVFVGPDGRTNVPEPRVRRSASGPPVDSLPLGS